MGTRVSVSMIGHKRFGSREGGVEVVVTELARRMAARGMRVTCYDRSGSDVMTGEKAAVAEHVEDGVAVVPVRTIDKKGLAALSSSFFATLRAIRERPSVIHYHAEGPCVPLCLAHWAGIRTVATIHGLDWQRAKWGRLASAYIKLGEKMAARYADEVIVLSRSAQEYFKSAYGRQTRLIPNGIDTKEPAGTGIITTSWVLGDGDYVLFLGRLVPEKRPELLIKAFESLDTAKKLVIAGAASDTSAYVQELRDRARGDDRVVFTGFVTGEPLAQLFSHAAAYVLPSDVEGMPISLLEAMAYGRCCITSDIPECADVLGDAGLTFKQGSEESLAAVLALALEDESRARKLGEAARLRARAEYGWDRVVDRTVALYEGRA